MARNGLLHLTIFCVLVAILCQEVFAIKCWHCTSEAEFCDDPFDANNVDESTKRWAYVDCAPPPPNQFDQRTVCKKVIQKVNDESIISRSCFWENIFAASDHCMVSQTPSPIYTEFCETCSDDGCNGAIQHGATALLILISAILNKIYLF